MQILAFSPFDKPYWGPTMQNLGSLACSVWAVGGDGSNAAAHLIIGGNLYTCALWLTSNIGTSSNRTITYIIHRDEFSLNPSHLTPPSSPSSAKTSSSSWRTTCPSMERCIRSTSISTSSWRTFRWRTRRNTRTCCPSRTASSAAPSSATCSCPPRSATRRCCRTPRGKRRLNPRRAEVAPRKQLQNFVD